MAWLPLAPAASPLRPLPRPRSVPLGGGGLWSHLREAPLGRALGGPRPWPLLAATGREGGGPHFQGPVFMPGASHQARGFRVRLSLVVTTLCEVGTCVLQQEKAEVQRGAVTHPSSDNWGERGCSSLLGFEVQAPPHGPGSSGLRGEQWCVWPRPEEGAHLCRVQGG